MSTKVLEGFLNSFENLRKVMGPFYRKMLLNKISGSPKTHGKSSF